MRPTMKLPVLTYRLASSRALVAMELACCAQQAGRADRARATTAIRR
jgi:hypothetical protein